MNGRVLELNSVAAAGDVGLFLRRNDAVVGVDIWIDGNTSVTGSNWGTFFDNRWSGSDFIFRVNTANSPTERMRLSSGGNLGIGTSTPQWLLNPTSATAAQLSLSAGGGLAQWAFRNAGGNLYFATTTVAGTATTSSSALTILGSSGNVGIGTRNPVYALDVNGDVNVPSGSCFRVNGVCIGYTVKLAAVYATSTPSGVGGGGATTTVQFTGAQGSAPSHSAGASPTLTLPSNTSYIQVETWGGGGGGATSGSGGSSGGYVLELYSSLASKYFYRIGTGGAAASAGSATLFGDGGATTTAGGGSASGGPFGTASGGDINLGGQTGTSVAGGSAPRGGRGGLTRTGSSGNVGDAFGGGGGGGDPSGGAGGAGGLVIAVYATSSPNAAGNDYAEMFPVSNPGITAGDIVAVDVGVPVSMKYAKKGDVALAGVVATDPGYILGDQGASGMRPIALMGRVPVKFNLENGPVSIGDRIAPSSVPGVGMKAGPFDDSVGIVIGPVETSDTGSAVMIFLDLRKGIDIDAIGDALLGTLDATTTTALISMPTTTATTTTTTIDATTTATTTTSAPLTSFMTKLLAAIKEHLQLWFANAANGITEFFAKTIRAEEGYVDTVNAKTLCLEDICVTKEQLQQLLNGQAIQPASAPAPVTPATSTDPLSPPVTETGSGTTTEAPAPEDTDSAEPVATSTPESTGGETEETPPISDEPLSTESPAGAEDEQPAAAESVEEEAVPDESAPVAQEDDVVASDTP